MTVDEAGLGAQIASLIRDIPDFPKPGVTFKDITPLLDDHATFTAVVGALAAAGRDASGAVVVDKVVGMEARGFILAAPVALALGVGFVPVRKPGKLPWRTRAVSYELEYGEETLEMHTDALAPGSGCWSSTTCSQPAAPPAPPRSWSSRVVQWSTVSPCCWS